MRNLPKRPARNVPEHQKLRLLRWLEAWEEQKAFDEIGFEPIEGSGDSIEPDVLKSLVEPFDAELEEGQIRLMPARGYEEPLVLLLLKQWTESDYLVAPFTAIGVPATPTELKLRDHMLYSSLCLWNVRTLPNSVLADSWIVDECSELEMQDARSILQVALLGEDVPEQLLGKTGAPIFRSEDPRIDYQDQYLESFKAWVEACGEDEVSGKIILGPWVQKMHDEQLAVAAAVQEARLSQETFESEKHILVFFAHHDHKKIELNVYDRGNDDQLSGGLDGCVLAFGEAERSEPIADGRAVFELADVLGKQISIEGPDGGSIEFTRGPVCY